MSDQTKNLYFCFYHGSTDWGMSYKCVTYLKLCHFVAAVTLQAVWRCFQRSGLNKRIIHHTMFVENSLARPVYVLKGQILVSGKSC